MASRLRNLYRLPNAITFSGLQTKTTLNVSRSITYAPFGARGSFSRFAALVVGGMGLSGGVWGYLAAPDRKPRTVSLTQEPNYTTNVDIPEVKPSRVVGGPATSIGLDLELYQYQTCPFCCKVRAFLDYYGIPYKVIEVNPVMRQQIKFSKYKKVPILIAEEKNSKVKHQLNDSSAIVSILGTFLLDIGSGLERLLPLYAPHSSIGDDGKEVHDIINKYYLMFGENRPTYQTDKDLQKEVEWRKWADNELVHILSPNIYRSVEEALQAFNYFSDVGDWEQNFSAVERIVVVYVGAAAMYLVGKRLRKKYSLKEDVRESLYDACRKWTKEVGTKRKFHGGDLPNLADLSVYGLLSSIEGCLAFQDLLDNTNIGVWYYRVKEAVNNNHGYQMLNI